MLKFIVLSVLVASALTARLSPYTRMPHHFDDMVHNNLAATADAPRGLEAVHQVSKAIALGDSMSVVSFLAANLGWLNQQTLMAVAAAAAKVEDGRVESHYVFQAFPEESKFRYALVNLVRSQDVLQVAVSQEERAAFGVRVANVYHDVRSSLLGLPFDQVTVVTSRPSDKPEFHEFNRNRLMADLKALRGSQKGDMLGFDITKAIGDAKSAVTDITGAWKEIVGAFKTVSSNTLKDKITGEGFKQYRARSKFIRSIGIPNDKWSLYKTSMMKLTGLSSNPRIAEDANVLLELAEFLPENTWNANDFTFDITQGGTCNSFIALTKNDLFESRSHVIMVVTEGSFQLVPHTLIYTKHKSIAGGIFENTKDYNKEVPRGLTEGDIKGINAMMLLNSLQIMADNFGVPFKFPDL